MRETVKAALFWAVVAMTMFGVLLCRFAGETAAAIGGLLLEVFLFTLWGEEHQWGVRLHAWWLANQIEWLDERLDRLDGALLAEYAARKTSPEFYRIDALMRQSQAKRMDLRRRLFAVDAKRETSFFRALN